MTTSFEIQSRYKAAAITFGVAVAMFLLLYFIPYSLGKIAKPEEEMGMLVNLGDSPDGSGNVQPMSDAEKTEQSSAKAKSSSATQLPDAVNTQETEDAPSVETPKKSNPTTKAIKKKPIENPKPDPEKVETESIAKELADKKVKEDAFRNKIQGIVNHSNQSKSEGNGQGTGDKGVPDGDPNAKNYSGENTGLGDSGSGPRFRGKISHRVRRKIPTINDNSKEEGKVAINISVDENGNVVAVNYSEKGSSTSSSYLRGLALKAARDIKFSPKADVEEETGTVIFSFKNR